MLRTWHLVVLTLFTLGMLLSPPVLAETTRIDSIVLVPDPSRAVDQAQGRVVLSDPAPEGGAYVHLSTSRAAWIPGTVVVPVGQTTAIFTVFLNRGERDEEVVVRASLGSQMATSNPIQALRDPQRAQSGAPAAGPSGSVHAQRFGQGSTGGTPQYPHSYQPSPAIGPQIPGTPTVRIPSMWDWRGPRVRR